MILPHHFSKMGPLFFWYIVLQLFGVRVDGIPKQHNYLNEESETIVSTYIHGNPECFETKNKLDLYHGRIQRGRKESATPPFQNLILYFFNFWYMYMHTEDGCPTPRKYPFIMQTF